MITSQQIKAIMPFAMQANIDLYLPFLNEAMELFRINTPLRQAHFLAQVGHESGSLRYVRELASGKAYDTGKLALSLGNTPKADGDGQRYKGRGLIQLTGTTNYRAFNEYMKLNGIEGDIMEHPELLETPRLACIVSGWFWYQRNLNVWADRDDVVKVTKIINGGRNGLSERVDYLNRAKIALGWI